MDEALSVRLSRLEAIEAIRQLASRYALGLDTRNIDMVVDLFVDDGRPVFLRDGDTGPAGGDALRAYYNQSQRRYSNSQHVVCNHVIDIDDEHHAHGVVYCLVHQELDDLWTITAMQYWDDYELIDGRWVFARRKPQTWYYTDWTTPPTGPLKLRFPGQEPQPASLPGAWPSWDEFWAASPTG